MPDLLKCWRAAKVKGLIIGGLAVALLGRPRITRDVDAIVILPESEWAAFLKTAKQFSFHPRLPGTLAFAKEKRILLLHHIESGIDVDISLGALPFEIQALGRAQNIKVGRLKVPVATVEDLIVLKAVANRDTDKKDIQGLLDSHPKLDLVHIRKYADEFAMLLELPEIYQDLDRMLSAYTKKKHRKKN